MSPLQFARALELAQTYHSAGMSHIEAVTQACRTVGISTEWGLVVQLVLEAGPGLAEDWCNRQVNSALDRAYVNEGAFR